MKEKQEHQNNKGPNMDLLAEGLARALGDQFGVELKIWFEPKEKTENPEKTA